MGASADRFGAVSCELSEPSELRSGVEWSEVELSGLEWNGVERGVVEWSGVEWSGEEWSGVEWSGVSELVVQPYRQRGHHENKKTEVSTCSVVGVLVGAERIETNGGCMPSREIDGASGKVCVCFLLVTPPPPTQLTHNIPEKRMLTCVGG